MTNWLNKYKLKKFQQPAGPLLPSWYFGDDENSYHQQSLYGWDSSMGKQYAGPDMNIAAHSKAGDLNEAFSHNQTYTSNFGNVANDVQHFYNMGQYTDAIDFMNKYNSNIDTLNNFWKGDVTYRNDTNGHTATDATAHNRLFKDMFNSRSIKGGDIGYQGALEGQAGSQTWLRRADWYDKPLDQLTPEEKAARSFQIDLGNGNKVTYYKDWKGHIRMDNTPPRVPPETPPGTTPPVVTPPGKNPPGSSIFNPAEFRKKTMPNFAWSDWAPLGGVLAVNNLATEWNRSLASKLKSPLEEAPYLQSKVTDAYYTNSALNERASNIKNQFGELAAGTSDINAQQRLMQQGSEQVNPLYVEAANAKQNEFRQTTQQAQEVANKNNLFGVEARNKNNKSAVALGNAILNANAKRNEEWATNVKDFTNKMYNSYTDALQTYRLNELARNAAERSMQGQQEIDKIDQEFADIYRDPTKSSQFDSFLNELKNSYTTTDDRFAGMFSSDQDYNDFMSSLYGENGELTPEAKAKLLELWNTQNDFASKYRGAYNTDLNNLYYMNQVKKKNISNRVALENAQDPYYISNQLHFNWQDKPFGAKNGGTLKAAKGAKLLSNLDAFLKAKTQADKIKSKESIAVDTQMYKNLNAELDRLNKEQLLLLKTIFK